MGAGFKIQIVNATPYAIKRTYSHDYQMEWNPVAEIAPNSIAEFYGEFKETVFKYSIDDAADATYNLDGINGFAIKLHAKKKGVNHLPSPYPPSESGYGLLVEWDNQPTGIVVYPPPDEKRQSPVGWIHDGVVTLAVAYFPGLTQAKVAPYPTPNYGSGGMDDDRSALKPSIKHWAQNWLEQFQPCLRNLKLTELTLPGSHDAGTFKADGVSQPWVQTQYLSLQQQLEQGIRAFDIRLIINGSGNGRFQFCHGDYLTNLSFLAGVQQINNFLRETGREVVILDFHRFEGTWSETDFKDLAGLIEQSFADGKIIPFSQQNNTLGQILATAGRVVIGMGSHSGNLPANIVTWLQQNTPFWTNAVEQYWCGSSITTWDYVQNYLNQQLQAVTAPKVASDD
jgi:1-phosphatidylinositol phosphodiesterase